MKNSISFRLWGRYALFADPITKMGGEKCSYHIPTYEAIKGALKSIYWKPTFVWYVDKVRVMKKFRTQTKGTKRLVWDATKSKRSELSIYTFLHDVEYQVLAHFEWNEHRPELAQDRVDGKHYAIAKRSLEKGGRQDIFLGVRDCQGYVEPCEFGAGEGCYDDTEELGFGLMFHSFDYPDETGKEEFVASLWRPNMKHGVIEFIRPEECETKRFIREMKAKPFGLEQTVKPVELEETLP